MRRLPIRRLLASASFAAMMVAGGHGYAQSDGEEATADRSALDVITVTARKREETLQDVPISVVVVGGEFIEKYRITDFRRVVEYLPNVAFSEGSEAAEIQIRGLGNAGGTNFGFDSPVGLFIDGVAHGRLNQLRTRFLDMERIEVLRGPQSTLFGMNSVVGAISIVTRKPTDEFEGYIRATHDFKHDNTELTAAANLPIADDFAVRVSGLKTWEDGFYTNTLIDSKEGGFDDDHIRVIGAWTPTDNLSITGKYEYFERFQDGVNVQMVVAPMDPAIIGAWTAIDPDVSLTHDDLSYSRAASFRDIKTHTGVLTVEYDRDAFSVVSLTSYTHFEEMGVSGLSNAPLNLGGLRRTEDFEQISQELRIASNTDGFIDYLAGVYYQNSDLNHDRPLDFILGNFIPIFAGTPSGGLQTYNGAFEQNHKIYAVFGQATLNITERLAITGGLRYSHEEKTAESFFDWLVPGGSGTDDVLVPGTPEFDAADFVFNAIFQIVRHTDSGDYSEDAFLPEVKIEYDVTDDILVYGSFGIGQKSGGFNDRDNRAINFAFDPERTTNYELGAKASLFDNTAQLNISLFRTQFKDMQVSVFDLSNLVFIVDNAASALSQGIEADGRWRISDNLIFNGSIGWLETAKFKEFLVQCVPGPSDPDCVSTPDGFRRDDGGNALNAPKFNGSFGLEYLTRIPEGALPAIDLSARVDVNHRGKSQDTVNGVDPVGPFTTLNGRIELAASDHGVSVAVIGNNLTDQRKILSRTVGLFPGQQLGSVTSPRSILVQLGFTF